jgi:hypothetical protein
VRQRILDFLSKQTRCLTPVEIANGTGLNKNTVRRELQVMLKVSLVARGENHAYGLPNESMDATASTTSAPTEDCASSSSPQVEGDDIQGEEIVETQRGDRVPDCPVCGHNRYVRGKEWRYNAYSTRRVYHCTEHGCKMTPEFESTKIPKATLDEIETRRLDHGLDLAGAVKEAADDGVHVVAATISNALRKRAGSYQNALKDRAADLRSKWGIQVGSKRLRYLLVDSTDTFKAKSSYLDACMDEKTGDIVAYQHATSKNAEYKIALLRRLTDGAKYQPDLVVIDRDPAWGSAVKTTLPYAAIQYCAFHLKKWLNERLPTKGKGAKGIPWQTRRTWRFVKYVISAIADSPDKSCAASLREVLERARIYWENDARAKGVVEEFLDDMPYYLTYHDFPEAPNTTGRLERFFGKLKENKTVREAKSLKAKADAIDLVISRSRVKKLHRPE